MILIGERINGMFKDVGKAIRDKDPGPIREWAVKQAPIADYLDLNVGPHTMDQAGAMEWLVDVVQEAVDTPLSIDSPNFEAIEAGLRRLKRPGIINSCPADRAKIEQYYPLAKSAGAKVVALTMNESGIPKDADSRAALAMEHVAAADEFGLPMEELLIDPLILPAYVAQDHGPEVLQTIRNVKILSSPPPRTVIGLSNLSQKALDRPLVNRTFLVMAMAAGLDAAIVDVCDDALLDSIATARILLNQEIYAESYLKAFRARRS